MFFRKQSPPISSPYTRSESSSKVKETHSSPFIPPQLRYTFFLFLFLLFWFLLLLFWFPSSEVNPSQNSNLTTTSSDDHHKISLPTCDKDVSVYIYELPSRFNFGLLAQCQNLNIYTNMCPHVANRGLGQPLQDMAILAPSSSANWFATHQFIAEMIFHARVENHPCRTWEPNKASLFFVPFYGGLHASSKFREANHTERDALAVDLVDYIQSQPWWKRSHGKDHFLALGRTAWDFMRTKDGPDFGANVLLNLPAVQNMSVLTVERHPWTGSNQHGIPYSSYFHPKTDAEMLRWQQRVRDSDRPYLFSFVGGKRKGLEKAAIRDEIVRQCGESTHCMLLQCGSGASKCHEPSAVLDIMTKSQFCLQAAGDSFTRRSTFDSVLAGCIPVFFSPHTAYTQYAWYLPEDRNEYSVHIDEKGEESKKIEEVLLRIPGEKVKIMREVVINLIPRITYAHPNRTEFGFEDAVDVALSQLGLLVQKRALSNLESNRQVTSNFS